MRVLCIAAAPNALNVIDKAVHSRWPHAEIEKKRAIVHAASALAPSCPDLTVIALPETVAVIAKFCRAVRRAGDEPIVAIESPPTTWDETDEQVLLMSGVTECVRHPAGAEQVFTGLGRAVGRPAAA